MIVMDKWTSKVKRPIDYHESSPWIPGVDEFCLLLSEIVQVLQFSIDGRRQ